MPRKPLPTDDKAMSPEEKAAAHKALLAGGDMKEISSDLAVKSLKPSPLNKPYRRAITGTPGLMIVVQPSGAKTWEHRWTRGGKTQVAGLGPYPEVGLAAARKAVAAAREVVFAGKDPIAEKRAAAEGKRKAEEDAERAKAQANERSFEALARVYITRESSKKRGVKAWTDKTTRMWTKTMGAYAYPILGKMAVGEIGPKDMLRVLQQETEKDPLRVLRGDAPKGALWDVKRPTANQVFQRINAILVEAQERGWRVPGAISLSALERIEKSTFSANEKYAPPRAALAYGRMPAFYEALGQRRAVGALAFRFLILTALRSNEGRQAHWGWLRMELGNPTLVVGREFMKGGVGKKTAPHRVPLSKAALALLAEAYNRQQGDAGATAENIMALAAQLPADKPIFVGHRGGALHDPAVGSVVARINAEREKGDKFLSDDGRQVCPHGARSSFRHWAGDVGVEAVVAEHALDHSWGTDVQKAYTNDHFIPRVAVMEKWGHFVAGV